MRAKRKKSKTQEFLEAHVIVKHKGKIDLKKLWDKVDIELEREKVKEFQDENPQEA